VNEPQAPSPKPQAPSPKPQAPSPKPQAPSPKPQAPSPKPYIDISQAVIALGISERSIRRRISTGELEGKKVGRKWWVQAEPSNSIPTFDSQPPQADPHAPLRSESAANQRNRFLAPVAHDSDSSRASSAYFESFFDINRIGAWHRFKDLRTLLRDEPCLNEWHIAASYLFEGFLAYGPRKTDCYHQCRRHLCRLVLALEMGNEDEKQKLVDQACETLKAVHFLIISLSRRKAKKEFGVDNHE
jgi:hypothetical protein